MKLLQRIINEIQSCGIYTNDPLSIKHHSITLKNNIDQDSIRYIKKIRGFNLFIETNIDLNYYKVIDDIYEFSISKLKNISLATRILNLKDEYEKSEFRKSNEFKNIANKIKKLGFIISKDYILWNRYIPIKTIIFEDKYYHANSNDMKKLGLGIKRFRVKIDPNIYDIECVGNHPQSSFDEKNPKDICKFCIDLNLLKDKLSVDSLLFILASMKIINLDFCYRKEKYQRILREYYKKKEGNENGIKK